MVPGVPTAASAAVPDLPNNQHPNTRIRKFGTVRRDEGTSRSLTPHVFLFYRRAEQFHLFRFIQNLIESESAGKSGGSHETLATGSFFFLIVGDIDKETRNTFLHHG